MGLVCDSLNMCKEREEFISAWPEVVMAMKPDFCPFCGKKWFTSAISENEQVVATDGENSAVSNVGQTLRDMGKM